MKKTVIDLSGAQGNAFYIIGIASKMCKELSLDKNAIVADMTSSDYEHLLSVF